MTTDTRQTAFRLSVELIQQIDEFSLILCAENPGLRFSRADTVRFLLYRALKREQKPVKKRRQKTQ